MDGWVDGWMDTAPSFIYLYLLGIHLKTTQPLNPTLL